MKKKSIKFALGPLLSSIGLMKLVVSIGLILVFFISFLYTQEYCQYTTLSLHPLQFSSAQCPVLHLFLHLLRSWC